MACCNKSNCGTRKEALLDTAILTTAAEHGAAIISKLLEIGAAGGSLMYIFQDNPKLTELAEFIKVLAAENQYLKKRLTELIPPSVEIDTADLTLKFGPDNEYALIVPAGNPAHRGQLAGQLITAAAELMGKPQKSQAAPMILPAQKVFPFVE